MHNVVQGSGPSSPRISDPTILKVPGCNAGLFERCAKMSGVQQIVLRLPESAMDKNQEGMRSPSGGYAQIPELNLIGAVGNTRVSLRSGELQNILRRTGSSRECAQCNATGQRCVTFVPARLDRGEANTRERKKSMATPELTSCATLTVPVGSLR